MDSSAVSSTQISAAIEINRNHGTMRAWQFLAQLGFPAGEIFLLLKDAPGPEKYSETISPATPPWR